MSLDSILWEAIGGKDGDNNEELKFLFVGGKGGVGKTTSSSAISTLLATKCNRRVLLVSTDPAHSLSDAFLRDFSNEPTEVLPNLHVMEVDPTDTMKSELKKWAELANDLSSSSSDDGGSSEETKEQDSMIQKIHMFQEWLSGVPGIDEATALASAVRWIESGDYDMIVFDTAPTGHTLKLLQMPDILQAGIEKLQSWQGTVWGYWEMLKGLATATTQAAKKRAAAKEEIAKMLEEYKRGIQKVAMMLQDQQRTRFVVVCIAEYLSVSETRRLLQELKKNKVRASNIVVNQLVVQDSLSKQELDELEQLAEVGTLQLNSSLLNKTVHACRLTTARKGIQEKYLAQLKSFPEAQELLEGICEMPLLPCEVTGCEALQKFGELMVRNPPQLKNDGKLRSKATTSRLLYEDQFATSDKHSRDSRKWTPHKGDAVKLTGLVKSAQYNGLEGVVIGDEDPDTGRFGIQVEYQGKTKNLALQIKNLVLVDSNKKSKRQQQDCENVATEQENQNLVTEENVSKAKKVLDDPEIKVMVEQNPRFSAAVQDVMDNPMNFMKYLMDPEMSPLIQKAMGKLQKV